MTCYRYEIETTLDLGDLGVVPASVVGAVIHTGLFGPGHGYFETEIEKVVAHLPGQDVIVTPLISAAAQVSLREELEAKYESERRRGA